MKNGPYELVRAPDDYPGKRYRGRYCYEHILVWWRSTGKLPESNEVVHHKNGKQRDNRFTNLELKTRGDHTREHCEPAAVKKICCGFCGREFKVLARVVRAKKTRGQRKFFCTHACSLSHAGRGKGDKRTWTKYECPVCRDPFTLAASVFRLRQKRNKTGKVACSKSCGSSLRSL
jgi:hypothetical protein